MARASYSRGKVIVGRKGDIGDLARRGFGRREDGEFVLEPWEALYLLEKGRIEVLDGETGRELGFQELLNRLSALDEQLWVKYLIYRDLRERGYVVKRGFGPGIFFRLYERGTYGKKAARFLVYCVLEGSPVSFESLEEALRAAQGSGKELILAVVDRRGEVVYYSLAEWSTTKLGGGLER